MFHASSIMRKMEPRTLGGGVLDEGEAEGCSKRSEEDRDWACRKLTMLTGKNINLS